MKKIDVPVQCAHRVTCINYNKKSWLLNLLGICNDHACNFPSTCKPVDSTRLCSNYFEFPLDCPLISV